MNHHRVHHYTRIITTKTQQLVRDWEQHQFLIPLMAQF